MENEKWGIENKELRSKDWNRKCRMGNDESGIKIRMRNGE